jgi:hypothetical protein
LRPTAILLLDLDETIAVANTGSGTVSEFTSPEAFDGFGRLADVTVGGTPSALVVADSFAADLNDDATDDLVVGDTSRGVVTQLLSLGRSPWFTRGPVFASGPVDAMAVGNLDRDRHPDLAVTDRGRGRVLVLRGTRGNGFGAPAVVASGVDPVAMLAGQFGGDYQDDLLVADARTSSLRLLLTPGYRLLSAGRPAREVVAVGHGRLLWSEQTRRRRHRLVLWSAGSAQRLPVRPSERPLVARTGRVRGHRAVGYVRCRADRCRPFAWDLERGREHRLRLPAHPGCTVRAVAVWNRTAAFELAALGCRAPGLWIHRRGHKARRVSATGELGALRGGRLAFRAKDRSRFIWRIRVTGRRGRVRTLDRTTLDLSAPRIVASYAYWTKSDDFDPPTLLRTRIDRPTSCWESWPRRRGRAVGLNRRGDFEAADFAVHGERLFYADRVGVFEVEPERIRWHRSCRR